MQGRHSEGGQVRDQHPQQHLTAVNPKPKLRTPMFDEVKLSLKLREQSIAMRLAYR
jgi:hypothetical protein